MKERCIRCNAETAYDVSTHIDMRVGYIEGAGQLCINCYRLNEMEEQDELNDHLKLITVPVSTIKNTPNDQELGGKVRQLYWESL